MKFLNFTLGFIVLALFIYVLSIGKNLLLPLVIALILFYIILNLAAKYRTFKYKGKSLNRPLSLLVSIITISIAIWALSYLINSNINSVIDAAPEYQLRLEETISEITGKFGREEPVVIRDIVRGFRIYDLIKNFSGAVATFAGSMGMIVVYLLFLLLESKNFRTKSAKLLNKQKNHKDIIEILFKINSDMKRYLSIKFISSLTTGILSYLVLAIVGVDFANFWALLIFLLNFIPTIGSIVATLFPTLLTLIQFDTVYPFIAVSILLISIQVTIGTILEPRFMGKSLNLSPIVILVSLALWGKIWGLLGMFLSVPIMVSMNIVLAKFPKTKPIAILLSADGDIE